MQQLQTYQSETTANFQVVINLLESLKAKLQNLKQEPPTSPFHFPSPYDYSSGNEEELHTTLHDNALEKNVTKQPNMESELCRRQNWSSDGFQ